MTKKQGRKPAKKTKVTLLPLTPKEIETLEAVTRLIKRTGYVPTRNEVALEMGVSTTLIFLRFKDLDRKGYLQLGRKQTQRTTRVLHTSDGSQFIQ